MKTIITILLLFLSLEGIAQQQQWANFTNSGTVNALIQDGDYLWVGTDGGLTKFNKLTLQMEYFNMANSGLLSNKINGIAKDSSGNLWLATSNGLSKFDGMNWQTYYSFSTPFPTTNFLCVAVDKNNLIWIGTGGTGLLSFDGMNFKVYSYLVNSGHYFYNVAAIAVDTSNKIWMSIHDDYNEVILYNPIKDDYRFPVESNDVNCFAIDKKGNVWFGHGGSAWYWEGTVLKSK